MDSLANHYPPDIYNEAKKLFVQEGKSPREIAKSFVGKPSAQTIARWAAKQDKEGASWHDLREQYKNEHYEALSTKQMVVKIYEQIHKLMQSENVDADKLVKLTKSLERLADPKYHIPIMYEFLTDLIDFLRQHFPDMVTDEFLAAMRDFKNLLRLRLIQ